MAKQRTMQLAYPVSVYDDPEVRGALRLAFAPGGGREDYIVSVRYDRGVAAFNWVRPPAREEIRAELEEVARQRITARQEWLERLRKLLITVKGWAEELGWATRIVEKKMEDAEIGDYKAPALLLQRESVRLFLDPVARDAPGTDGAVDLCLMPTYDDIASLYHYNNRWNLHYMYRGSQVVANGREGEAKPLTKAAFRKVLDEMKAHAE
jgi:hypothetical protein